MAAATHERRGTRRFSIQLPVALRLRERADEIQVQTKDVSARGVYFYVPEELEEGSPLDFTLTLPPEITLTDSIRVRCRGRAIRVDREVQAGKHGVAAIIDDYQFLA